MNTNSNQLSLSQLASYSRSRDGSFRSGLTLCALLVLPLGAGLLGGCSKSSSGGNPAALDANLSTLEFTDATDIAGVRVKHTATTAFPAFTVMFSAAAAGDFDNDGWQDLFVVMGGLTPDCLFMNNGDGTFSEEAAVRGVGKSHVGAGIAVGDYNNDGSLDVFIMSLGGLADGPGPGHHLLYKNQGDGTFVEVAAAAGVATTTPGDLEEAPGKTDEAGDGFGAAWGDFDRDGDLDLFTTGWDSASHGNLLFQNNGDETFTDITLAAIPTDIQYVRGFTPRFVDMDGDMWPEILLNGDFGTTVYLVNNCDGTFTDQTVTARVNLASNSMGQAVADFNDDGLLDWMVTSIHSEEFPAVYTANKVYINQGNHVYKERAEALGLDDAGWGWGVQAADMDHDTYVDVAVTGGWFGAGGEWTNEQSFLFLNRGNSKFKEVSAEVGYSHFKGGRGLVLFDYDNDGDQDVVICASQADLTLLRNDVRDNANYLRVFLDTSSDATLAPNGYGSMVHITAGGKTQMRSVCGGPTYLAQSEMSAHFGLGITDTIDELKIVWADGSEQIMTNVAANQTLTVVR